MTLEVVSDPQWNKCDSTVLLDKKYAHKLYHTLSLEQVKRYNEIQSILSKTGVLIPVNIALQNDDYLQTWVNKIQVNFVDTDVPISSGSCTQTKAQLSCVTLPKIKGPHLCDKDYGLYDTMSLIGIISEGISQQTGLNMSNSWNNYRQLHSVNIKVPENIISSTLEITITDIACDIEKFVEDNQNWVNRLV